MEPYFLAGFVAGTNIADSMSDVGNIGAKNELCAATHSRTTMRPTGQGTTAVTSIVQFDLMTNCHIGMMTDWRNDVKGHFAPAEIAIHACICYTLHTIGGNHGMQYQ